MSVATFIPKWLSDNTIRINLCDAYLQKGGVEGWLQVELARALMSYYTTVEREVLCYSAGGARADIVCTTVKDSTSAAAAAGTKVTTAELIELKCASLFQDASNATLFAKRIGVDYTKISTAGSLKEPYKTNVLECISVGISVAAQMSEAMDKILNPNYDKDVLGQWSARRVFVKDWVSIVVYYQSCKPT